MSKDERAREDSERFRAAYRETGRALGWKMVRVTAWLCLFFVVGTIVLMTLGRIAGWW